MLQNKVIHATSQSLYHAFHLELEEQRSNLTDREVCVHTQYIYLEILKTIKTRPQASSLLIPHALLKKLILSLGEKFFNLIGRNELLLEDIGTSATILIHTDAFYNAFLVFPVTAECCDRFLCHSIAIIKMLLFNLLVKSHLAQIRVVFHAQDDSSQGD